MIFFERSPRENDFEGLTSMQVFLGLYLDFDNWKDVPLIRISNQDIQKKLGIRGKYAAFSDIVNLKVTVHTNCRRM